MTTTKTKPAPLANTRSRAPLDHIFEQIAKTLTANGVQEFTFELDANKQRCGIRFTFREGKQLLSIRMPARVDQVRAAMIARASTRAEMNAAERQAFQVAWATIRDWVRIQFALINIRQAHLPEIFLPYIQGPDGRTLYEQLSEQGFKLLPSGITDGEFRDA